MKRTADGLLRSRTAFAVLVLGLATLTGCGAMPAGETRSTAAETRPAAFVRMPEASGAEVYTGDGVTLDASHKDQGYVMMKTEQGDPRLKARIEKDDGAYNYDQPQDGAYETYPLQMGSGEYDVQMLEQVEGNLFSRVFEENLSVTLEREEAPYLYPNQFVSYTESDAAILEAQRLASGTRDDAEAAERIYRFVADEIQYDYDKAALVASGYLPVPDETLSTKKGICFDYAALLAAMLRSQGIPTKLVIGYVAPDNLYHAWNEAYIGGVWKFYDPTLDGEGRKESDYMGERIY